MSNMEFRIMKFSYPSTFIIPCSLLAIFLYGSLWLCMITFLIHKKYFYRKCKNVSLKTLRSGNYPELVTYPEGICKRISMT